MSLGYARSAQLRGAGVDLVREGAHGDRDGDVFGAKNAQLVLPVETSRRDAVFVSQ